MYAFDTLEMLELAEASLVKKADDPKTPQGDIREIQSRLHECRRHLRMKREDKFRKESGISVSGSDDYIGAGAGDYSFYYGYEETYCPVKSHKNGSLCGEKDCEKEEWCFTADKDGKEVARYRTSELSTPHEEVDKLLILGMAKFIKENMK